MRENSHHNHVFHYEGGIKEFVEYLNRGKEALYDEVIYCEGTQNGVYVEVALQHNDSFNDSTFSFVNNVITPREVLISQALEMPSTKTFNAYAREKKILKDSDPARQVMISVRDLPQSSVSRLRSLSSRDRQSRSLETVRPEEP